MNKKQLQIIFEQKTEEIFSGSDKFCGFLCASANIYKYSPVDQVLICAQIREPAAVATFEQWNRLGRRVNRGAVGIYHLTDENSKGCRGDLFDLSDTNGPIESYPKLWQYPPDADLYKHMGLSGEANSVEGAVLDVAKRVMETVILHRGHEVIDRMAPYQDIAADAVACTVLKRLGMQPEI